MAAKANYPKCAPKFIVDIQVDLPPERPGQSAPAAIPTIFVDDTQEWPHPTTCQSDLDSRSQTSQRALPEWELAGELALIRLFVRPSTLPIVGSYIPAILNLKPENVKGNCFLHFFSLDLSKLKVFWKKFELTKVKIAFDGLLNHKISSPAAKFGYFGIVFTVKQIPTYFYGFN